MVKWTGRGGFCQDCTGVSVVFPQRGGPYRGWRGPAGVSSPLKASELGPERIYTAAFSPAFWHHGSYAASRWSGGRRPHGCRTLVILLPAGDPPGRKQSPAKAAEFAFQGRYCLAGCPLGYASWCFFSADYAGDTDGTQQCSSNRHGACYGCAGLAAAVESAEIEKGLADSRDSVGGLHLGTGHLPDRKRGFFHTAIGYSQGRTFHPECPFHME